MKARTKDLIGRTIVAVSWQPTRRDPRLGKRSSMVTNPVLTLDDGRSIWFVTEETETGEYGHSISVSRPVRKKDYVRGLMLSRNWWQGDRS